MTKLKPMKFERNQYGCWMHPVYGETWKELFGDEREWLSGEQAELFKTTLGVDLKFLELECDKNVSIEEWDRMHKELDLSKWTPEIPEGYFEVGYWFTEDDAVAVFAQEKEC